MKINTFKKYEFTADFYDFSTGVDSSGGETIQYSLAGFIRLSASTTGMARLFAFIPEKPFYNPPEVVGFPVPTSIPFRQKCQLANLRDAGGNELIKDGVWVFESVEPILNNWGHREGFKAQLSYFGQDGN